MAESPVEGKWTAYICDTCYYSWRSTEDPKVAPIFKLTKEKIPTLGVIPPVPPLDPQ